MDSKETIGVTGPGGLSASASGFLSPLIFAIAMGFGVLIYISHLQALADEAQHLRIETQMGRMADGIDVQNWLLSIPQDRRPRLLKPYGADRFIENDGPTRGR